MCGVPPAAHTSLKRRNELSMKVTIGCAWPSGATPPIAKPLCSRTNSGRARSIGSPHTVFPIAPVDLLRVAGGAELDVA